MKCPKCFAVCMDTDPACYSCKEPLRAKAESNPLAYRIASIGAVIGACMGPIIGGTANFARSGGLNWANIMHAGLGGMIGGALGLLVGVAFFSSKKES